MLDAPKVCCRDSEPPLTEDQAHSLGQVVHGAIRCHRWVSLIAGPEEEEEEEGGALRQGAEG